MMLEGITGIRFVQFMRPDGRKVDQVFAKPADMALPEWHKIIKTSEEVIAAGYTFTAEVLVTGQVSLCVEGHSPEVDETTDIINVLSSNGPGLDKYVLNLVNAAHKQLTEWDILPLKEVRNGN